MATKVKSRSKPAATIRRKKAAKPAQTVSTKDVAELENSALAQKRSERSWQDMTSSPPGDDRWTEVEESLVKKPLEQAHSERRWKYYSK